MCSTELKWVSQGYRLGTRAPLIVNTAPTPATPVCAAVINSGAKNGNCFLCYMLSKKPYFYDCPATLSVPSDLAVTLTTGWQHLYH